MREHLNLLFWFTAIGLVIYFVYFKFINAPAHTDPSIPIPYSNAEGKTMLVDLPVSQNRSIPPIDADAPKKTETATFALG